MYVFSNTYLSDSSVTIHLHGLVCISIMYPSAPPFVALKVELGANRLVHNIQLKELEREININFKHLTEDDEVQVLTCVDIVFSTCMQCVCVCVCVYNI